MSVRYELKKLFSRKELHIIITILVVFACTDFLSNCLSFTNQPYANIHSAWQLWIGFGNSTAGFFGNILGSILCILLPVFVTIPFSDSYMIEKRNGLSSLAFVRERRTSYYAAKAFVSFMAGFVLACLPYVLNLLLCLITFPTVSSAHYSNWPASSDVLIYEAKLMLFPEIDLNNPALSSIIRIVSAGLFGSACSFLGTAVSFFAKKRILASAGIAIFIMALSFFATVFGYPQLALSNYLLISSSLAGRSIYWFIGLVSFMLGIAFVLSIYKLIWQKDEL